MTSSDDEISHNTDVAVACVVECYRQQVSLDRVGRLIQGYDRVERFVAHSRQVGLSGLPTLAVIQDIAKIVEPKTGGKLRKTPVVFASGGSAASPGEIPGASERLFSTLDWDPRPETGQFVLAFLKIHPFCDGNGRLAFLLYNWLEDTLGKPASLPNYFGDSAEGAP